MILGGALAGAVIAPVAIIGAGVGGVAAIGGIRGLSEAAE